MEPPQPPPIPKQLIGWLYDVLQPQYSNKQLCYTHIVQLLQTYFSKGFRIRTRVHTSDTTGLPNLLINIYGKVRNTNIEMWIPLNYPFNNQHHDQALNGVPFVYVIPDNANGVYIKPGNFIDSQGKFFHPYLTDWFNFCRPETVKQFNLINLMRILDETFKMESPIFLSSPNAPIPPPKPVKSPELGWDNTGSSLSPQMTGPPLPLKPLQPRASGQAPVQAPVQSPAGTGPLSVPPRYQAPLPLPQASRHPAQPVQPVQQTPYPPSASSPPAYLVNDSNVHRNLQPGRNDGQPISGQPGNSRYNPGQPSQSSRSQSSANVASPQGPRSPSTRSPPTRSPQGTTPLNSPSTKSNSMLGRLDDLMDRDDRQEPRVNRTNEQVLQRLSNALNATLDTIPAHSEEFINKINLNSQKIDKLYQQLTYHNNLATANKNNLVNHRNYLTDQVAKITTLNTTLQATLDLNAHDAENLYITPDRKIKLDELVVPDSVLTNQLYSVVAEIKANKDCIALIGGSFEGESELINDDSFESCVKSVRAIGRESFWLELTKHDIAKKMAI